MIKSGQFGILSIVRLMATSIALGALLFGASRAKAACGDYLIGFDLEEMVGTTKNPIHLSSSRDHGPMRPPVPCSGLFCKSNRPPTPIVPVSLTITLAKQHADSSCTAELTEVNVTFVELPSTRIWQFDTAGPPDPPPRFSHS